MVLGSKKHNNTNLVLNKISISLSFYNQNKYLGVELNRNLNFNDKFQNVINAFFSLNSLGLRLMESTKRKIIL